MNLTFVATILTLACLVGAFAASRVLPLRSPLLAVIIGTAVLPVLLMRESIWLGISTGVVLLTVQLIIVGRNRWSRKKDL